MLIGYSIINHPFWGTSIFGNTNVSKLLGSDVFRVSRTNLGSTWIPLSQGKGGNLSTVGVHSSNVSSLCLLWSFTLAMEVFFSKYYIIWKEDEYGSQCFWHLLVRLWPFVQGELSEAPWQGMWEKQPVVTGAKKPSWVAWYQSTNSVDSQHDVESTSPANHMINIPNELEGINYLSWWARCASVCHELTCCWSQNLLRLVVYPGDPIL